MATVTINDNHLKDIADTIRSKNETETKYKPSEMADAINELVRDDYYIDGGLASEANNDYLLNRLIVRIPPLDTSNRTTLYYAFQRCNNLVEIPELDCGKITVLTNAFANNTSLKDFGGLKDIGKAYLTTQSANYSSYTVNFSAAPNLTHESLMNIINGLYDIASLGVQTQILQLGSKNLAKLTEEEIGIAQSKGWTVS